MANQYWVYAFSGPGGTITPTDDPNYPDNPAYFTITPDQDNLLDELFVGLLGPEGTPIDEELVEPSLDGTILFYQFYVSIKEPQTIRATFIQEWKAPCKTSYEYLEVDPIVGLDKTPVDPAVTQRIWSGNRRHMRQETER